jgi:cephalosporin-C deacetylase-like acetyl esterase
VRRALPILIGLAILAGGCGGDSGGDRAAVSTAPATVDPQLLSQFDYDAAAPLDVQEVKSETKDGAVVHDITYAGPEGRIDAFLIVPEGDGPFPAVEFMPGAPGARYTFFTEAMELARKGVVSFLPDPPYARPPIQDVVVFKPSDKDGIVQEVKEMRRGIDLLVSRHEVDPSRLGYVGFSWGGSLGAIFSAVERRVHSFVLMSLVPHLSSDMRKLARERGVEGDLSAYEDAMQPIDAVNYLPHAAPSALFLQAGAKDTRPSPADTHEAFDAASSPKKLALYPTEHELNDQARADMRAWLAHRLGVQ